MASEAPKVRIVRCPKCLKLLPELASISVYQCGKCGTTLRAKKRKEDQENKIAETRKTEHEHDSDKESTCSSQKALSCSADGSEQVEHQDFAKVKFSSRRTSNGSNSSDALNWRENEASSSVAGGSGEEDKKGRGFDMENPSSARQGISGGSNSTSAAQKPLKFNASSLSEELEISEKIVRRYADLIRSKSPVRIAEATNSSIISADNMVNNKLQGGLGDSRPSATKTFHAYEGSVSPNSDSGHQVFDLHSSQSKDSYSGHQQAAVLVSANTGDIREDGSANRGNDTESEVQNVEKKLSSTSLNERHSPVANDSVISEDDMVTDKRRGELGSSDPSVAKVFHAYKDSGSSSDSWGDQDIQSCRAKGSSLGSQSLEELVSKVGIGRDISGFNRNGTESEVQNQEREFSLTAVNKKHGPVTDDSIISKDDMVGVSNRLETKSLNSYDDSVSSSDGCCEQDTRSYQSEKYFPKSRRVKKDISTNETATRKDNLANNMTDTGLEVQTQESSLQLVSVNEKHGQVNNGETISEDDIASNKLDGVLEVAKPPATKTFHAYDASISSNDGWGDQVSDVHSHQPRESFDESHGVAELVSTNDEEFIRDGVSLENTISTKSAIQNHPQKASLMSVKEKHPPTILGDVSPPKDEIAEDTRYPMHDQMNANIPSFKSVQTSFKSTLSWLEEERDGLRSTQHFGQRDYENTNLPPPRKLESVERNQLELLRRVDELSAQLNRSYAQSRKANERFPPNGNHQERQRPLYYKPQSLPEPDMLHQYGIDFPRHPCGTYRPSKSLPFQYVYPLSGNVANYRSQANCTCSSVYSEDLLQANVQYSEGQCRAYPDHACYNLYGSGPSSPERHLHSHYPMRSCEMCTVPHDHTDRAHNAENLRRRERRHSVKKHCRPIAGGAPFISCYNCNKLLYLPADSFHSSKRRHQLQCSSCSKVLVFSLLRGTHVAPFYQEKGVLAPSEVNSSRGSNSTRNSVFKPRSYDHHGGPLSYSEDAGLSIRDGGGSTDGELADRNAAVGKHVKKTGNHKKNGTRANNYGNRQVFDSGSPSYNEAESARGGGVATLHELMGYSTVSRILKASDDL